ncbi:tripartite motif-containing protein 16-like protein [Polypterus senegalus]|uniref:tripartite motif-containing protein 16-like protein n=1 Tax=Polypterus senegalus TaxID=55291 RepID=UPI0019627E55|nr:tripartite motif-containing protein 16-like protein [Polypterus senegalus]
MAEAQLCGFQDETTCSVCLDTLSDPATIPCGHNFCLKCITNCWSQSQVYRCPLCRDVFFPIPQLRRNTLLNEVIQKLKKTGLGSITSQNYASPGDVECDACTGKKFRAVKSCLTCPASYCQIHLKPHFEGDALKHHKLVDADGNLKKKLCAKHQKSLEIFCKTDEMCICMMCVVTGHKNHKTVELETEREEKLKQLGATLSVIRKRIKDREKKLDETRGTMGQLKSLLYDGFQKKVEQNFSSCCVLPADGDSLSFTVTADFSFVHLLKELSYLKKSLEKISERETMTLTPSGRHAPVFPLQPPEPQSREEFLQYFCPLTLDINTAHRRLSLSEGNKKVTHKGTEIKYPDHPDRFDRWYQVLCREALSGTHSYFEVEWSGHWMSIGVAYKAINRNGQESILGYSNKSWTLRWFNSQYSVRHNNTATAISAPYSPRIGVYLDWPAGCLSFYSVSHTMTLLHRFNTYFTEPLYPGFGLDYDSSVTICHLTQCGH